MYKYICIYIHITLEKYIHIYPCNMHTKHRYIRLQIKTPMKTYIHIHIY